MTRKYLVGAALAVLTTLGVLTACSESAANHDTGTAPDATAPSGEHNDADVAFLQQMIPHHAQAVEMSTLVKDRTTTAPVVDLAGRIEKAQGPEIKKMTDWLESWSESTTPPAAPSASGDNSMPGMDHGSHGSGMPGMMSEEELAKLEKATGAAFDQQWLSMMVAHHQGAVDMATTEIADGSNAEVKALAQRIVDAQQAEIKEMQGLLGKS